MTALGKHPSAPHQKESTAAYLSTVIIKRLSTLKKHFITLVSNMAVYSSCYFTFFPQGEYGHWGYSDQDEQVKVNNMSKELEVKTAPINKT